MLSRCPVILSTVIVSEPVLPPVKKFAKIGGEKVGQPGGQK